MSRPPAASALVAAVVASGLLASAPRWPHALRAPLTRTSYAGRHVTLAEGPAWVVGAAAGAAVAADGSAALVVLVPGAVGLLDDLAGDTTVKGLRGHLGALREGRVTSGVLKIGALAATALAAAVIEHRATHREGDLPGARFLVDAALVAGTANLLNLFDLRPGRALKVATALALPLLVAAPGSLRPALAAGLGATLGTVREDLAGRSMLGDCGANASGALVGQAAVRVLSPRGRGVALVGVTALTLLSERVSFSAVIDSTPPLRRIDAWGR